VRLMLSGHSFGRPMRGPISRTPMAVKSVSNLRTRYCFYTRGVVISITYPLSEFMA
jgi:hypothetical protein